MPHWAYYPYHLFWQLVDGLFPPQCVGCGQRGARWCPACQQQVEPLPSAPLCARCGYPLATEQAECPICAHGPGQWAFDQARAWAWYRGMTRRALLALKYGRNLALGETLARRVAAWARGLPWPKGCLVPVPLAPARLKARGYNQVALVARPLAWLLEMPYCPAALTRRDGPSQVGMQWAQRWANVRRAFRAVARLVRGRVVWLVDDVMTTGATLHAAARALKQAGAHAVYALTWARVPRHAPGRTPVPPPTFAISRS